MYSRTIDLLGEEGHERLRQSFVIVIGLGGVGSHAVVALARAGVRRFRIVDADVITTSSLNRHATAVADDVGLSKAEALRKWMGNLDPSLEVEAIQELATKDTVGSLLEGEPDMVIDAIDSVAHKEELLAACAQRSLPVISCMGASSRTDPSKIVVADISETTVCPLARRIRKALRRRGIEKRITVVFSTEEPLRPLPPDENEKALIGGGVRPRHPSLSTLPGIFGYVVANATIVTLSRRALRARG